MVQYYWNPNQQQSKMQNPNMQHMQQMHMQQMQPFQQMQQTMVPPPVTIPSGRPNGEQSYIENILRLNIGQPGTFHFSFTHTVAEALNVRNITGYVVAAGRDHVIVHESSTDREYLFPMIYFDYADFEGEVKYFPQTINSREV